MSVNNTQIQPTINEDTQKLIGGLKNNIKKCNEKYKGMLYTNNFHKKELVENWIDTARYIPKLAKKLIWKYMKKHPYLVRIKSSLINEKSTVKEIKLEKTNNTGKTYTQIGYIHYHKDGHSLDYDDFIKPPLYYRERYDNLILYKTNEPQEYTFSILLNDTLFDIDINKLLLLDINTINHKYIWIYMDIFTPKDNFKELYDKYKQTLRDKAEAEAEAEDEDEDE